MRLIWMTLIFTLVSLTSIFAQNTLFERGYDFCATNSQVNTIIWKDSVWLTMGYEGTCRYTNASSLNEQGQLVTHVRLNLGLLNQYLATKSTHSKVYAAGSNQIADDYLSPFANGFIHVFENLDSVTRLVADTNYKHGFDDMDVKDSIIVVTAGKKGLLSGWSPANYLVAYDTSGNWLWETQLFGDARGIRIVGDSVMVFYDNESWRYDLQGQLNPNSQMNINGYRTATYQQDSTILLLGATKVYKLNSRFQRIDSFSVSSYAINPTALAQDSAGNVAIYASGQVLLLDNNLNLTQVIPANLGCARVTSIAMNGTTIALAGHENLSPWKRGFVKTYSYQGQEHAEPDDLVITQASTTPGLIDIYDTITLGSVTLYQFSMYFHVNFTVQNTGTDTISGFTVTTSSIAAGINCSNSYGDTTYKHLIIRPGETYSGSIFNIYYVGGQSGGVSIPQHNLYISQVNQGVNNNSCNLGFNVPEKVLVGLTEPEIQAITLYPNPASNTLYITPSPQPVTVSLFTLDGRLAQKTTLMPGETTINISQHSPSIYLYQIETVDKHISMGKVIIQR